MQIKTLEYFLETADTRSISRAAERLYISQQGLSKALANLERELGVQLFVRGQNGLELTNEGSVVAKHTSVILREYAAMNDKLQLFFMPTENRQPKNQSSSTRIIVMPYIFNCMFGLLQSVLRKWHLDNYTIESADLSEVLELLNDYSRNEKLVILAGLPACHYSSIIGGTRMQFFPLFSTEIALLSPKKFVTPPHNRPVTSAELASIPLMYFNEQSMGQLIHEFLQSPKAFSCNATRSESFDDMRAATQEGRAARLTDTFSLHLEKPDKDSVVRSIRPTMRIHVGFFAGIKIAKGDPEHQYIVEFQNMIKSEYGAYVKQNQVPHPNYNWSPENDRTTRADV